VKRTEGSGDAETLLGGGLDDRNKALPKKMINPELIEKSAGVIFRCTDWVSTGVVLEMRAVDDGTMVGRAKAKGASPIKIGRRCIVGDCDVKQRKKENKEKN
jgi:hypothetical protein